MPTPDMETLAARLRAVERALTDESTALDPPATDEGDALPPSTEGRDGPDADTVRTDGAGTDIERRLCRLEAAVQALRAALGTGTDPPVGGERDQGPVEAPEPVTPSDATRRTGPDERPPARGDPGWPDDLADGS